MSIGHNELISHGNTSEFTSIDSREKRLQLIHDGFLVLGGGAIEVVDRFASLTGRHKLNPLLGDVIIDKPVEFEESRHGRHHISKEVE
ncbi:MAG TPA: hypothetical protein VIM37_03490 [Candidatus Microsaccharimonas sp.]|jgi:hypothetical protein